ncbi:hypothetical protein A1Q1_03631 [Trichosporon asahii var. asahii CBS 2479]|uniref:Beta-lactamase-related domain-containing protein n=1 Tax=Trichosporon asahii var. asahii (strain ATCC 90039 / CBS 2479 / JCM 2466 / KCTC 7840 / NBRC 103889/ NCYC 2677 / UAMH 7654) TaxID=1186058 RepID=J6ESL7_TRIAS|nr:hypothetical protein A1Q1_03631 [Trichosporon asahii var. asahii CBS 2479]EJT47519.1 hypothetical protein A1Q1_03631 [Trichosporon asahii var. asahii CBS 2479]
MLPRPQVTQAGRAALSSLLKREVSAHRIPATFMGVTNADGELFWAQAGLKEFGNPASGEVAEGTMLQLFSMTKLVTSLVDRGMAALDDPDLLDEHIPEISKQDILVAYDESGPTYVPKKKRLTLRMLLSHSSGLGYAGRNPLIGRWQKEHDAGRPGQGAKEWLGPLCFEPQTRWRYGTSVDWAGILLERVSGMKLGDWMQANIFAPLGITSITFEPSPEAQAKLMTMTYRKDRKELSIPEPAMRPQGGHAGIKRDMNRRGRHNGGGGLYGTARDYLRFLRGVLASRGAAPGEGILSRAMFEELFTNALPPRSEGTKPYADCAKSMAWGTFTDPELLKNDGQGLSHSVGFMISTMDSCHGRKAGSGTWDGAAKSEYWVDPTSGIAAVFATNLTSPNPDHYMKMYNEFERTLYDSLEEGASDAAPVTLRSNL